MVRQKFGISRYCESAGIPGTRLFILGTSPETDEDIAMLLFYLPIIIFEAMLEANANRREADESLVIE
jgi:hypothetical protein